VVAIASTALIHQLALHEGDAFAELDDLSLRGQRSRSRRREEVHRQAGRGGFPPLVMNAGGSMASSSMAVRMPLWM
jgi:hypothetical protein